MSDIKMDETKPTLNEFERMIRQWGEDRNITAEGGATVLTQMSKMQEEFVEFLSHYEQWYLANLAGGGLLEAEKLLADDFGDMLVCLIQAMRLAGTDMETCLAKAWDDIKDRKGTMVNGKFVKEQ